MQRLKKKKNQGSTHWTEKMSSDTISWFGGMNEGSTLLSGQCVQILYSDLRKITKDQHFELKKWEQILYSDLKERTKDQQ